MTLVGGLVVYEMSSCGEMTWVVDPSSRKVFSLRHA